MPIFQLFNKLFKNLNKLAKICIFRKMRVILRVNSKAFCQLIISMTAAKVRFFIILSKFLSKNVCKIFPR